MHKGGSAVLKQGSGGIYLNYLEPEVSEHGPEVIIEIKISICLESQHYTHNRCTTPNYRTTYIGHLLLNEPNCTT